MYLTVLSNIQFDPHNSQWGMKCSDTPDTSWGAEVRELFNGQSPVYLMENYQIMVFSQ